MQNFKYSFLFGILATLLNIGILAVITIFTNNIALYGLSFKEHYLNFSIKEVFLFSIILCAVDTISSVTFISLTNESQLFFILFGEGVLNNGVCVLLFKLISKIDETSKFSLFILLESFNVGNGFAFFFSFLGLVILSFFFGLVIGK